MRRLHWDIALRQTNDPGHGLSAFLSRISVVGMVIAISLLLAALSVMNGFDREMRLRILNLVPHVTIRGFITDSQWREVQKEISLSNRVVRQNQFVDVDALLIASGEAQVARLLIADGRALVPYVPYLQPAITTLEANELVIGADIADKLNVVVGDRIPTLFSRRDNVNRLSPGALRVVSILRSDTEVDQLFVLAGKGSASINAESEGSGIAINIDDPLDAPRYARYLRDTLSAKLWITDWTSTQGNLYQAIQLSRQIVALMLTSLVVIAIFNVVTSLVLVVSDRQAPTSMLRAIGLGRWDVAKIFLIQGTLIGAGGAILGTALGLGLALGAPYLVQLLEVVTGNPLLDTSVYPLAYVPVDIRLSDFILVPFLTLVIAVLSCSLPALAAARLQITHGLRESR